MARVTTDEAEELCDDGVSILDVRTPEEFAAGHIPGARNIPLRLQSAGNLTENAAFVRAAEHELEKGTPLLVYCRSGNRSAHAARMLESAGFAEILDMSAGWEGSKGTFGERIPGWVEEGHAVATETAPEQLWTTIEQALA